MNGYNFTERVRRVLQSAREEAIGLRHEYVGTEHLLLALMHGGGVAEAALTDLGVDLDATRARVLETVRPGPDSSSVAAGSSGGMLGAIADKIGRRHERDMPYTSRAKKSLELAIQEARHLNHSYVGTEHLLLGLMREERGVGAQVLAGTGISVDGVRKEVIRLLGTSLPSDSDRVHTVAAAAVPREDHEVAITVVIEHPDGRLEARKFRHSGEAARYLNGLEY
ncbi:MAG TPA: Clp protease N-terminal domain-containing protein [Gemmatimonadaceae bacterium]